MMKKLQNNYLIVEWQGFFNGLSAAVNAVATTLVNSNFREALAISCDAKENIYCSQQKSVCQI